MSLRESQADLDYFLQRASEALGAPVRPLTLELEMATYLTRHARRVEIRGLGSEQPVRGFHSELGGHSVVFGLTRYLLTVEGREISLVRMTNPFSDDFCSPLADLWATPVATWRTLYRALRRSVREHVRSVSPIMRPDDRRQLWDNTIGFLQRGEEALERFGVPLKRGVLLMGEPGNGKTMAARWLHAESLRHNLAWRTVRAEDYESARGEGDAHRLFDLERPGIVLFDDFDSGLRHRDDGGPSRDQSTFLSELDGIRVRRGIVYLFTTNARLKDLDPAFRRPGRIDRVIQFPRPDADLRWRLIDEHWPREVAAGVPVEEIVQQTADLCFAEIEELKKLLVLRFLDVREWDWPWAWQSFRERGRDHEPQRPLGFHCNGHTRERW